jgi:sugar phosphate isomerase/epimerase
MGNARIPVALQLYTVREEAARDFIGTLRRIAAMGYAGVQISGNMGGLSAQEMKRILSDLGLRCAGAHVGLMQLENELSSLLDYYAVLECPYLVLPVLPREFYEGKTDWAALGARLNKIGAACRERGMGFAYHNHDMEFRRLGDRYLWDIILDHTDPALVKGELDTYWAVYAGADPAAWLEEHPGRCPLLHLKDMAPGPERAFAEVGEGIIDFKPICARFEAQGGEWYVVEQDLCARPPLESAALSLRHLREGGIA